MPLFDYECKKCNHIWEAFEWSSGYRKPIECPFCKSVDISKCFSSIKHQVRMDPDSILKSMPDPSPPLEELRGKTKPGCVGGYEDKPEAPTRLRDYTRERDKYGNAIWKEKRRTYFGAGGSRKSSAEKT